MSSIPKHVYSRTPSFKRRLVVEIDRPEERGVKRPKQVGNAPSANKSEEARLNRKSQGVDSPPQSRPRPIKQEKQPQTLAKPTQTIFDEDEDDDTPRTGKSKHYRHPKMILIGGLSEVSKRLDFKVSFEFEGVWFFESR